MLVHSTSEPICSSLKQITNFKQIFPGDNLTHFQDVSVLNEDDAEAFAERRKSSNKKRKSVKLPKKVAKKLAKRSKKRLNRKKMNL